MSRLTRTILLGFAAFGPIAPHQAFASDAASTVPAAADNQVADIIVTAQKREERLQDVPVAVTAVGAPQLASANVSNVIDLNIVAPAVKSTAGNGVYLNNTIRGVGSLTYGAGIESPVGLYVDNVYQAAPFSFSTQLNNVASVEVLKGPQGTLFGRNATGGVINIHTMTPSATPSGKFALSYGNYGLLKGEAYISGGVSSTIAADIAFTGETQRDGFGYNPTTKQDWNKLDHNIAVRSKIVWDPGDTTKVTVIGDYFEGKGSSGAGAAFPGKVNTYDRTVAPDLGYGSASDSQFQRTISGGGGSVQIEQNIGSLTLNSISAYRTSRYPLFQDIDFTAQPFATLDYHQKDRQFSQEFQLTSPQSTPFRWTLGLFYFDASADVHSIVDFSNFPFVAAKFDITSKEATKSYAAYGQGTYALGSATNFTLGIRYTSEKRAESNSTNTITFLNGFVLPLAFPDRSFTESQVTWRASLDHRFSNEVMAYASFNTGFKSGGFNSTAPGADPFRAEKLTAYEVGVKSDLLDRHLRLNVSGFYYDYTNVQVQRLLDPSLFIINGPKARIYGVDADFTAVLTDELSLSGGATWISPRFREFLNCPQSSPRGGVPLVTVGTSCTGNLLPLAAKLSFSGMINYTEELPDGAKISMSANVYYNSGFAFEADNVVKQGPHLLLGANARYTFKNGVFVGAYGRNLTNKRIIGYSQTQANGNPSVNYQNPRTYGATIGFSF